MIVSQSSEKVAAGRVISVEPSGGTKVPVGTQVTIVVSTGPEQQPDPEPTGDPGPDPTEAAPPPKKND